MTRREFIGRSSVGAVGLCVPPQAPAMIGLAGAAIAGAIVIAGGIWAGYQISKVAQHALRPCPPVPGSTNAVPPMPGQQHPSNSGHSLAPERCMGRLASDSGVIAAIDTANMTDEERGLNTLPDGSQAANYATAVVESCTTLGAWSVAGVIEVWLSGTCYVVRCGEFVQQGLISRQQPPNVVVVLSGVSGPQAFLRL